MEDQLAGYIILGPFRPELMDSHNCT